MYRAESPVGDWTIRVWDQENEKYTGHFLGWNMILWGLAKDGAMAQPYQLPAEEYFFPPQEDVDTPGSFSSTKEYGKPTVPPETPVVGEASPTATDAAPTDSAATASTTPTMDEGWFSGLSTLSGKAGWVFGGIGVVAVFGIGAGVFLFRRRRAARRSADYATLAGGEDVPMSTVGPGGVRPRTKELYDAFGEVSDDEDADEETHLRGGHHSVSEGIGFHSGFLDDDEPQSAGPSGDRYRDEPEDGHTRGTGLGSGSGSGRPDSPSSGSGGSWQHPERELSS